jgi:hypothetical protein
MIMSLANIPGRAPGSLFRGQQAQGPESPGLPGLLPDNVSFSRRPGAVVTRDVPGFALSVARCYPGYRCVSQRAIS